MATAESVKAKLRGLIDTANAKTGNSDADLTTAVNALVSGYGQGGSSGGIIDVTELPATGDEGAVYRIKVESAEVYVAAGGVQITFNEFSEMQGAPFRIVSCTVVDNASQQTPPLSSYDETTSTVSFYVYIDSVTGAPYVNVGEEGGGVLDLCAAMDMGTLEESFRGIAHSTSEMTGEGFYTLLINQTTLYTYENGAWTTYPHLSDGRAQITYVSDIVSFTSDGEMVSYLSALKTLGATVVITIVDDVPSNPQQSTSNGAYLYVIRSTGIVYVWSNGAESIHTAGEAEGNTDRGWVRSPVEITEKSGIYTIGGTVGGTPTYADDGTIYLDGNCVY